MKNMLTNLGTDLDEQATLELHNRKVVELEQLVAAQKQQLLELTELLLELLAVYNGAKQ